MKKMMINDRIIDIDMRKVKYSIDILIMIDHLYNLIVYEDCGIVLSFEWIVAHLKENHGIKKEIVDIMRFLNMMRSNHIILLFGSSTIIFTTENRSSRSRILCESKVRDH